MNRLLIVVLLLGVSEPGFAQEAPEGKAMQLTVRPSGYEEQNEALERQQKLLRRLEQSDHMIRSICVNCGDQWKHQIYAPFNPMASLRSSGQGSEAAEAPGN